MRAYPEVGGLLFRDMTANGKMTVLCDKLAVQSQEIEMLKGDGIGIAAYSSLVPGDDMSGHVRELSGTFIL